jgi:hypothetical protein
MAIPADAKPTPLPGLNANVPTIGEGGRASLEMLQHAERIRSYVSGAGRIIPCSCSSSSNLLTLTPNGHGDEDGEGPVIEGYRFGDCFLFVADANSTGSVTARVALRKAGPAASIPYLTTLKVYISNGSAQAGNGDITSGLVYLGIYAYNLDSNNGGIVIRHP